MGKSKWIKRLLRKKRMKDILDYHINDMVKQIDHFLAYGNKNRREFENIKSQSSFWPRLPNWQKEYINKLVEEEKIIFNSPRPVEPAPPENIMKFYDPSISSVNRFRIDNGLEPYYEAITDEQRFMGKSYFNKPFQKMNETNGIMHTWTEYYELFHIKLNSDNLNDFFGNNTKEMLFNKYMRKYYIIVWNKDMKVIFHGTYKEFPRSPIWLLNRLKEDKDQKYDDETIIKTNNGMELLL